MIACLLKVIFQFLSNFHLLPGSKDKQHLQTCLEAGLGLADQNNFQTISIPCVGTGGFGLTAADSAQVTFQALNSFRRNCKNLRNVRVVVFQAQMVQEFLLAQQKQTMQDLDEKENYSTSEDAVARIALPQVDCPSIPTDDLHLISRDRKWDKSKSIAIARKLKDLTLARQPRNTATNSSSTGDHSVKIFVVGKDKRSVRKAVDGLKKGFSDACVTQKVENETVSKLSPKQINILRRMSKERDIQLEIKDDVNCIAVRGDPVEVQWMVGEIRHEIYERNMKITEDENAMMVFNNVEWSYEIHGEKTVFSPKINVKLEMAYSMKQTTALQISLRADDFAIDLAAKTGLGKHNGEKITLSRKIKGVEEG